MKFKSKIEAIKELKEYSSWPLAACKEYVEAVMELGVTDSETARFVKQQLSLLEKL